MDNVRIKLLSTERHHLQFEEANGDISHEDTENILTDVSRRGEKRGKDSRGPVSPSSVKNAKKKRN